MLTTDNYASSPNYRQIDGEWTYRTWLVHDKDGERALAGARKAELPAGRDGLHGTVTDVVSGPAYNAHGIAVKSPNGNAARLTTYVLDTDAGKQRLDVPGWGPLHRAVGDATAQAGITAICAGDVIDVMLAEVHHGRGVKKGRTWGDFAVVVTPDRTAKRPGDIVIPRKGSGYAPATIGGVPVDWSTHTLAPSANRPAVAATALARVHGSDDSDNSAINDGESRPFAYYDDIGAGLSEAVWDLKCGRLVLDADDPHRMYRHVADFGTGAYVDGGWKPMSDVAYSYDVPNGRHAANVGTNRAWTDWLRAEAYRLDNRVRRGIHFRDRVYYSDGSIVHCVKSGDPDWADYDAMAWTTVYDMDYPTEAAKRADGYVSWLTAGDDNSRHNLALVAATQQLEPSKMISYVLYGKGGDGKSLYLRALKRAYDGLSLSTDGAKVSAVNIAPKTGFDRLNAVVPLATSLYALDDDAPALDAQGIGLLKQLSTGAAIQGRSIGKDSTTFSPRATIVMATNEAPEAGYTDSVLRRFAFVDFVHGRQPEDFAGLVKFVDDPDNCVGFVAAACEAWLAEPATGKHIAVVAAADPDDVDDRIGGLLDVIADKGYAPAALLTAIAPRDTDVQATILNKYGLCRGRRRVDGKRLRTIEVASWAVFSVYAGVDGPQDPPADGPEGPSDGPAPQTPTPADGGPAPAHGGPVTEPSDTTPTDAGSTSWSSADTPDSDIVTLDALDSDTIVSDGDDPSDDVEEDDYMRPEDVTTDMFGADDVDAEVTLDRDREEDDDAYAERIAAEREQVRETKAGMLRAELTLLTADRERRADPRDFGFDCAVVPAGDDNVPYGWKQAAQEQDGKDVPIPSYADNSVWAVVPREGCVVLDLDAHAADAEPGFVTLQREVGAYGTPVLPHTYAVRTPHGGMHLYYRIPDGVSPDELRLPSRPVDPDTKTPVAIELKRPLKGTVSGVGSVRDDGGIYRLADVPADGDTIPAMSERLVAYLRRLATRPRTVVAVGDVSWGTGDPLEAAARTADEYEAETAGGVAADEPVAVGGRNCAINAWSFDRVAAHPTAYRVIVWQTLHRAHISGLGDDEAAAIVRSVIGGCVNAGILPGFASAYTDAVINRGDWHTGWTGWAAFDYEGEC